MVNLNMLKLRRKKVYLHYTSIFAVFILGDYMQKEILGYENYTIDENGNIFSKKRNIYLKSFKNKSGYPAIYLCSNGKRKYFLIHRLVAMAFLPNPNQFKEINHKDENPANPSVNNLEWCTRKYNNNYGSRTDKCVEKLGKKFMCVETKQVFRSTREAERLTGIKSSTICMVCSGKRITAGGFTWKFL